MIWLWVLAAIVACVVVLVVSRYFVLWLQALVTGAHVSMLSLVLMSLRGIEPRMVVQCKVMLVQAGLPDVPTDSLESQLLAGGDIQRITVALVAANRANIALDWDTAAAIDLAGRDILEAVRMSVDPRVINCPDPSAGYGEKLSGVAKDGIQLRVRVRVTVRTNVKRLIGGATEATIIARVGEGIVSAIGSCDSYHEALRDPLLIARQVLAKGLDAQTAFSIVSIDIADIDVGANLGAKLQIDQAQADIRIAVAQAEQRRAMAVARLQEMTALTRQNEAAVVLAEAQIPAAVSGALRRGSLRTQPASAFRRSTRLRSGYQYPRLNRPTQGSDSELSGA
ncbi:MAG: flotillin-like protein FloA [Planctomycetaceae bacterium]